MSVVCIMSVVACKAEKAGKRKHELFFRTQTCRGVERRLTIERESGQVLEEKPVPYRVGVRCREHVTSMCPHLHLSPAGNDRYLS